jgi:ribosomal protein S18 acetylase RimI-like enzyme
MSQKFDLQIRNLTPADAAAYQAVRLLGLSESPTAFSASLSDEENRTLDEITARLTPGADGSSGVLGAFLGDELVGLLAVIQSRRSKLRHCAELAGMYVVPGARGRGIGGKLLDAAIRHARTLSGVRQLKLGVNADNTAARALYHSRGFERTGSHPEALFIEGRFYDEEFYILRLT